MVFPARLASLAAVASALVACSGPGASSSSELDDTQAPLAPVTWTSVGAGIHRATVGPGPNVLVVYGGYSASDADSEALAIEYASAYLRARGVGRVVAVRGPKDAGYQAREIGNSKLAAELAPLAAGAGFIAVVAHSSGAFVADELFTQASADVLAKVVYFALDGGSWALTPKLVSRMKGVFFCNASDPAAGLSANYHAMIDLHASFPASRLVTVDASGSGCHAGAKWCLHDALITSRPHNPAMYDLDRDYTSFTGAGRHVVVAPFERAAALLTAGAPAPGPGEGQGQGGSGAGASGAGGAASTGTTTSTSTSTSTTTETGAGGGVPSGDCALGGAIYGPNTCTETLQCADGAWVARASDPDACVNGVIDGGGCVTDEGAIVPKNTCTATLQCDDGVWVDRRTDPEACL
jgi:hypothetical protein